MFKWKPAVVAALVWMVSFAAVIALAAEKDKKGDSTKKSSAPAHARWTENLQEAIAASKKTGRPIMANFTGSDWCPPCMAQEREVFAKPEFAEWADDKVILLMLDFPNKGQHGDTVKQNQALAKEFKISGYPTIVFFNHKGEEFGRWSGYGSGTGVEGWVKRAQPVVDKAAAKAEDSKKSEAK